MANYDSTNKGTLFRNEKRESEKHPEFSGSCNIDGVEYWISAWVNESKSGKRYFSLKFKLKEDALKTQKNKYEPLPESDDEVPF